METTRASKMGTWPINKLLLNMSVPLMISMLVQALYNVVDSYFVSHVSEQAVTAVTLAFPLQNLMIAVAVGIGVGMAALLSRSLGEQKPEAASLIAMQGILIALIACALFVVTGLFFARPFIRLQSGDGAIVAQGVTYLQICCVFSLGVFMHITFERLLQSTGRVMLSMISQGVGALTNIVLDPILIFGLLGFPAMGVKGAAIATVIGQVTGACVGLFFNLRRNREIRLRLKNLAPHPRVMGRILYIGVPSVIMAAIGSFMTFAMNLILDRFSSTAVAVFGIYFKLQSFVFMPVFGLNNGMVPVVAYNLGARRRERIVKTVKLSAVYASAIMLMGLLAVQVLPGAILRAFDASRQMLAIGIPAFRTISLCFVFAGVSIVISGVCQAVGKSMYSMLISVGRQLVVLLPAAWLLSLAGDVNAVWWAFPIAEAVSLALCGVFLRRVMKQLNF